MIAGAALERDVLIVACAVSAGIHAALAPDHFAEGAGPGVAFAAVAALLSGLVVRLTDRRASRASVAAAGALLAGLIAGYALATTTGLPVLQPETEAVDGLALVTKAIEAAGLLAAVRFLWRRRPEFDPTHPLAKGRLA